MPSGNFNTTISVTPPITINQFLTNPPDTPGNVGVCLSGGGSRALSAGMGQLRGLSYLNLLGQVKALSTVSGGSCKSAGRIATASLSAKSNPAVAAACDPKLRERRRPR